jgi:hypothetical protein
MDRTLRSVAIVATGIEPGLATEIHLANDDDVVLRIHGHVGRVIVSIKRRVVTPLIEHGPVTRAIL